METKRPTYLVKGTDFSGGQTTHRSIVKALTAAKKRTNASLYRVTEEGETRIAQVEKVTVYTGRASDQCGDSVGSTFAYQVVLTSEGYDTLLDEEGRFFPRRA